MADLHRLRVFADLADIAKIAIEGRFGRATDEDLMFRFSLLIAALMASAAHAGERSPIGPAPLPAIGAACPSGYQRSAGACVAGPHTSCRAFPTTSSVCPSGYTKSFDYCVETGCQSR